MRTKRALAISLVLAVGCPKKERSSETASGSAPAPPAAAPAPVEPGSSAAGSAVATGSAEPAPPAPSNSGEPPFKLPPGGKPAKPRKIGDVMTGDGTAYHGSIADVGPKVVSAAESDGWKCSPLNTYPIRCKKGTAEITLRLAVNSDVETVLYISSP